MAFPGIGSKTEKSLLYGYLNSNIKNGYNFHKKTNFLIVKYCFRSLGSLSQELEEFIFRRSSFSFGKMPSAHIFLETN